MDNRPERVTLAQRRKNAGVMLDFIKQDKPMQNTFIKRFNRKYRTEILDFYLFRTLNETRGEDRTVAAGISSGKASFILK